jgi:hypothetical protein
MSRVQLFAITGTSPATATTSIASAAPGLVTGLDVFEWFTWTAVLTGATGGTLDVYLQRRLTTDVWADWIHFTQIAAAASAVTYTGDSNCGNTYMASTGVSADATATPALVANTVACAHPGERVRLVMVGGAGTSAGAAQTIYLTGLRRG